MSTDAKGWETTREANLLRHKASGRYYGRFVIGGKRKWVSLKTDVWTVAKVRMADERVKVERMRNAAVSIEAGAGDMGALLELYRRQIADRQDIGEKTRTQLGHILKVFEKTWPGFARLSPDRVTKQAVTEWRNRLQREGTGFKAPGAKKVSANINGTSGSTINRAIDCLRHMLDIAVERGQLGSNPIAVRGIKIKLDPRKPTLPDTKGVGMIFDDMERRSGGMVSGVEIADFARGLAYTGGRVNELAEILWSHIDFVRGTIHLAGTKTDAADRTIPLIPPARALFEKIWKRRQVAGEVKPTDHVFQVRECTRSLARACAAVNTPRLTHHDLRDVFATTCIEAGVDIPTVAGWLGHADGGTLLMKTYSHHRLPHSLAQAAKVTFAA